MGESVGCRSTAPSYGSSYPYGAIEMEEIKKLGLNPLKGGEKVVQPAEEA